MYYYSYICSINYGDLENSIIDLDNKPMIVINSNKNDESQIIINFTYNDYK